MRWSYDFAIMSLNLSAYLGMAKLFGLLEAGSLARGRGLVGLGGSYFFMDFQVCLYYRHIFKYGQDRSLANFYRLQRQ